MKKSLLAAAFALFAFAANAQVYVGGQFGFTSTSVSAGGESESISGTSFKILPEVGYNINDQWAVGIQIGYSQGLTAFGTFDVNDLRSLTTNVASAALDVASSSDAYDATLTAFRVAPYARYTFVKAGNFAFFAEGSFAFTNIKADNVRGVDAKVNAIEIAVRPGISYNLSKNAQVVAKIGALGYQHASVDVDAEIEPSLNRFGLEADGDDLSIGFNYQF